MAQGAAFQPPPEAVTTIVAQQEKWPATLSAIGTMAAVQGVTVSADLPGIVDRIAFESGASVREGDVLVAARHAAGARRSWRPSKPQRDLARLNFDRMKGLVNEGAISRAEYDRAAAEQKQTDAPGRARSAPPSRGRRSARRFRESSASARSTSGSTWRPAIRSSRCSRCIRST